MPKDDGDPVNTWEHDAGETTDDDEGTADGMIDDDDAFELVAATASPRRRPETSWDAVVEKLSRFRQGNA